MAKNTNRIIIHLVCSECSEQSYTTHVNKNNAQQKARGGAAPKLEKSKHCPRCRKHTPHRETTKTK